MRVKRDAGQRTHLLQVLKDSRTGFVPSDRECAGRAFPHPRPVPCLFDAEQALQALGLGGAEQEFFGQVASAKPAQFMAAAVDNGTAMRAIAIRRLFGQPALGPQFRPRFRPRRRVLPDDNGLLEQILFIRGRQVQLQTHTVHSHVLSIFTIRSRTDFEWYNARTRQKVSISFETRSERIQRLSRRRFAVSFPAKQDNFSSL